MLLLIKKIIYYSVNPVKSYYLLLEYFIYKNKNVFVNKNTLLLLRLDSIGDYILFRNFIRALKESKKYKDYKITLCGNSRWKDLALHLDKQYITEYIWVDYHKMVEDNLKNILRDIIIRAGYESPVCVVSFW